MNAESTGRTALYRAAGGGYPEVIKELLKFGADLRRGIAPHTLLQVAAASGNLEAVELLLAAGADMVLVHSKSQDPTEVLEFAKQWDRQTPLVCVPTTYATTPYEVLAEGGYRVVIFANHGLRAAIKAMRETLARIYEAGHASAADDMIVSLPEVYELIGVPEMKESEARYMPPASSSE